MVRPYSYYVNVLNRQITDDEKREFLKQLHEDEISKLNKPKKKKKTSGFMNVFGSIVLPIILGILLASMARCVLHLESPTTQPNPPAQTNKL